MDGALAWISQIAEWIGQFVPRWDVLDPTLGWLKYRRGEFHSCGRGGIVVWWPVLTKVETHSIAEQTLKLEPQSLTTKDCKEVTVRGIIVYEWDDLQKMGTTIVDPDDSVRDKALMVIAYTVAQHDKADLLSAFREELLDEDMRKRAQKVLGTRYGAKVVRVGLVELSGAKPYRVISGGSNDMAIPMVNV